MAQIRTKFIQDNAITTAKINNDAVTTAKILDANVTNAKIATGIDAAKLADGSVSNTEFQYLANVTSDLQTQLDAKIDESREGVANGIATLDAGGKVPVSQLPSSIMEYKGVWNASTNTPTLADGTGDTGDVYRVSVAGTQNLGSGSITFEVGDYVIYDGAVWQKSDTTDAVASVNGLTGVVVLDTDDINEGTTNLYHTAERAQDAVGTILVNTTRINLTYNDGTPSIEADINSNSLDGSELQNGAVAAEKLGNDVKISIETDSGLQIPLSAGNQTGELQDGAVVFHVDPTNAPTETAASGDFILIADVSDSNNLKKVTAQSIANLAGPSSTNEKEVFTLVAGDITNQYIDLANVARTDSIIFYVDGGGVQREIADYTVNYTGGAGGNTRITFAGDLATGGPAALVASDVVRVQYEY